MNYIVFNRDGSLLTQNMEYYVQQGNQGDTIFVGFLGANLFDTTIALFTLPDAEHTTNSVAGILTSKRIEIEGEEVEVPGWTITLTQEQTLYNGMLMTAIRILRDEQVIVSYPFYIVINETGVRPDSDTGVTIEEINSYLLQLQQVARGCLKFVDIDESTATVGSVEDLVGLDLDFAMIFNGCLSFCKLEKDINDDYTFSVCNPYGVFKAEDLARSSALSSLVWTDIDTINDNCIEIPYQGGVYSGTLSAEDLIKAAKNNAVISYNNGYYQKFAQTSTQATFYRVTVGVSAAGIALLEQRIVVTLASGNWETNSQLASIYTQAQVNSLIQDVNTALSSKEDLSNKVTSIDNESTDTQYPSAKCVYDNIQIAIEVANGKCKTWTISYQETEPTQGTFVANKNMRADGTKIATWAEFEEYITLVEGMGTIPFINSSFNSQSLQLQSVGYIVTIDNYVLINAGIPERDGCKNGDNIMVVQTEVPDRWYYAGVLCALETAKIDLDAYVTTNTEQSISGKKHFKGNNLLGVSGAGWNTDWYLNFNNTNLEFNYGSNSLATHYVMGSGYGSQPKAFYTPSGKDLGISSNKWKDLYLSGVIYLGGATELTQASDDSLQVTLSGDGKSFKPSWDGHYNLGASGYNWKDLYLSGALKITSSTKDFELSNAGNYITLKEGTAILADWGSSGMAAGTDIYPNAANKNLGTSTYVWNYLYVNNLSNGTGDMTSHCNLLPSANGALDLGSTAYLWSNVFTDALRMVGSTSQIKLTYDNDWAVRFQKSSDGGTTWSSMLYFSGNETYTRFLYPMGDKVYDLGYSSGYWKDLYLAGGVRFKDSTGSTTRLWKIQENNWGTLNLFTSDDGTTWGDRFSFQTGVFCPTTPNIDLGTSNANQKWRNLYLSGKISDGTNETNVANINANFAPKYDNTATYSVGDYVTYNGRLYTCTTAVTAAEDFDDTKWSATSMSAFSPSTTNLVTTDTAQQITGGKFFYRAGANGTPLPLRIQGFHNKTWGFETDYSWDVLKIGHADVNGTNISNIEYYYTLTNSAFYGLFSTVGQSQVGKDLGTATYPWKDAYVSGNIYYKNNSNVEPAFNFSNGYISVERNMYFHGSDAIPQGNCQLGTTSNQWKDLYLSGNLSDGTNSISIAQIVAGGSGATKKTITLTNDTWTQAQLQDVYTNAYDVVEIISSTGSNNIYKQYNNKTQDNMVTYATLPEPSNGIDLYVFSFEEEYALDVILGVPTVTGQNDGTNWTSLTIGEDTYAIPQGGGGTNVVANPTLAGTESNLTGIEISGTKYKIPSGGSSSGLPVVSASDEGKVLTVDGNGDYEVAYITDSNFNSHPTQQTTYTLTHSSTNTGYIDANGTHQNGSNYRYTPQLSIVPGSTVTISKAPPILGCWYDVNGNYLSGFDNGTGGGVILDNFQVTAPSNAYFVVINGKTSDGDVVVTYTTYTSNYTVLNNVRTKVSPDGKKELIVNDFIGCKYMSFGDSITWYNDNGRTGYQTLMKNKLGLSDYTNAGVAGATISTISSQSGYTPIVTTVLSYNSLSDYDLITVFGGTNDYTLNSPMGTLGTLGDTNFDTSTFYGGYRAIIEHILTKKPTARLVLITPIQRNRQNSGENNWTTPNTEGNTLKDYADAVKEVAKLYALPVVDLFYESGINTKTLTTFLADGLHPNDTGYVRIANCIMGELVKCGK